MRRCDECGNEQEDSETPRYGENPPFSKAFETRKCKKCKSESLDYGSARSYDSETGLEIISDLED